MSDQHLLVEDVPARVQYLGDGVQREFPFGFTVLDADDVQVWVETALRTSGFTVALEEDCTGSLTFAAAPAAGQLITLRRMRPYRRITDFQQSGLFRAQVINDELDAEEMQIQQLRDDQLRSVRLVPAAGDIDVQLPWPFVARRALLIDTAAAGLTLSTYDPDTTVALAQEALADARQALDKANAALAMAANAGVGSRKQWGPITLVAGVQDYLLPAEVAKPDDLDLTYGGVPQTVQWEITDTLGLAKTLHILPSIVEAPSDDQWRAGVKIYGVLISGLSSAAIANGTIQGRHLAAGAIDLSGPAIVPAAPNKQLRTNGSGIIVFADYEPSIEWTNVKKHGATGIGADDTAAINAAVAAMPSGGTLYFPPGGNYGISSPVRPKTGCVMGMANGSTITALTAAGDLFVLTEPYSHIEGLQFRVAPGVTRQAGNAAVKVTTGNLSRIRMCRFWDQAHSVWITSEFGATITLEALEINRSVPGVATCIQIDAGYDVTLDDVIISNVIEAMPAYGIYVSAAGDVEILNTQVLACQYGLNVFVPAGKVLASLISVASWFDNCGRGASMIADGGAIVRCGFNRCWFASSHVDHGFFAGTAGAGFIRGLSLTDCDIHMNAANGFTAYTTGVSRAALLGCRAAANGQSGIAMGVSVGAPVHDWSAVACTAGADDDLPGNTLYGIFAAATPTGHRVASNDLRGNGAGPWAGVPITPAVIGNLT